MGDRAWWQLSDCDWQLQVKPREKGKSKAPGTEEILHPRCVMNPWLVQLGGE